MASSNPNCILTNMKAKCIALATGSSSPLHSDFNVFPHDLAIHA